MKSGQKNYEATDGTSNVPEREHKRFPKDTFMRWHFAAKSSGIGIKKWIFRDRNLTHRHPQKKPSFFAICFFMLYSKETVMNSLQWKYYDCIGRCTGSTIQFTDNK